MMKKVLYGVALTLLASVSVGSLQSCKDDVNDLKTQTSFDLSKLQSQLDGESARLEGLISAEAAARRADIEVVNGLISQLQGRDTELEGKIAGALSRLDNIDQLLADTYATKDYVDGKAQALAEELEALDKYLKDNYMTAEDVDAMIRDTQEALTQALNKHDADIQEINDQLETILTAIDSIITRLDKQVTGILIQGVNSPAFGDLRTPLGVKSNILFNWYGKNAHNTEIVFPSNEGLCSATGAPNLGITPTETYTVPVGLYGDSFETAEDGTSVQKSTLGTVYVTLNPVGAKFDHLDLTVENSAGVALPVSLTLEPSETILYHGMSRTEDNGFYEGKVTMDLNEENLEDVEIKINEDLKKSMKEALKDPSRQTAKALINAVYEQLQGKIPAYGLRYGWNDAAISEDNIDPEFSAKYYSVLSQYDLAVGTALPLSYNFLSDYAGASHKLPTFGHIQNLINKIKELGGKFTFTFDPFTIDDITINLGEVDFKTDEMSTNLTIDLSKVKVKDGNKELELDPKSITVEGDKSGMNKMLDDIKNAINSSLSSASDQVNLDLEKMTSQIESQVNDMMAKINDQISGKINDIINSATSKIEPYYGKINKAIDLYNSVATKVNNFLSDPNAYLQVCAFYKMNNGYGIVSGLASDPTPFVQAGGDAVTLYLSSYTGELIVPACKKYVAVTAVNGVPVTAGGINSEVADLDKVLDGNQIAVTIPSDKLTAGNVYEFTYQALDFRGYTSTKKFYIEVK